jgi:hypothetical protein
MIMADGFGPSTVHALHAIAVANETKARDDSVKSLGRPD